VAEDAKLQFAFVRRGVIPELVARDRSARGRLLARRRPAAVGRMFSGREAAELGLASQALPATRCSPPRSPARASSGSRAPVSVALSKRLLWEGFGLDAPAMMKREGRLFAWAGRQADAREGVVSFLEKREPAWKLRPSVDLPER
jgi:enoyl-CoA hydratase/carnithine racemase